MRNALPVAVAAAALFGLSGPAAETTAARRTENDVEVVVRVAPGRVAVTFRPLRSGFHLYSIGLPDGGVDGLGIPTRLAVGGGLRASGPPTADRPDRSLDLPELGVALPVYPDGPVTFTIPVTRTGDTGTITYSYGVCSSDTCLAPVLARTLELSLR